MIYRRGWEGVDDVRVLVRAVESPRHACCDGRDEERERCGPGATVRTSVLDTHFLRSSTRPPKKHDATSTQTDPQASGSPTRRHLHQPWRSQRWPCQASFWQKSSNGCGWRSSLVPGVQRASLSARHGTASPVSSPSESRLGDSGLRAGHCHHVLQVRMRLERRVDAYWFDVSNLCIQ